MASWRSLCRRDPLTHRPEYPDSIRWAISGTYFDEKLLCNYSVTVKVRPHGQQFGYTTLYNKVVRHKTCCKHAKSCCATNVHTSTIFFINLAQLQRQKWRKYVQITSDSTQHLCETIMSYEFLLKWTDIWRFTILVAQPKMSHDTRRPHRPHYHNHDTFYVAQPSGTKSYD